MKLKPPVGGNNHSPNERLIDSFIHLFNKFVQNSWLILEQSKWLSLEMDHWKNGKLFKNERPLCWSDIKKKFFYYYMSLE